MMGNTLKKLMLNKETLRNLQDSELTHVAGGIARRDVHCPYARDPTGIVEVHVVEVVLQSAKESVCVCWQPQGPTAGC